MRTRQLGLFATTVCAGVMAVGSAAWACVPGHDHTSSEDNDHAAHAAAQAAAPAAPGAPVAPVTAQSADQQGATTVTTFAPVAEAAPAPASTPASRTAAPRSLTPAPAVQSPAPAEATPAPAVATPAPTAASPAPAPPVAPAATPTTAWTETVYAEVPAASEGESSGGFLGGAVVTGAGLALLALSAGPALLRWRRNARPVAPPALTD